MIQLFRKILCPIDCSEHSLAALDLALKVVQQNDAKLYLLSVSPVPAGAAGFQPVTDLVAHPQARVALLRHHSQRLYQIGCVEAEPLDPYPYLEKERQQQLTSLGRERIPAAVRYETLVISGDPAEQVLNSARGLDIDLIVMGTHGRKGLSHLVLGSVAERVVRE